MKPTTISFFSFLFVSLVLLGGCDSFGGRMYQGSISGTAVSVMDRETPVPFAKVVIYIDDGCIYAYDPECWIPIDSTIADEQGQFHLDYEVDIENPVMVAMGYKDQYFKRVSPAIFRRGSKPIELLMRPKTYFKVHIEDEYPYDYSKYVGMWLSHGGYVPNDTVYQFPLDTTLLLAGNPQASSGGLYPYSPLIYSLIYDRPNTVGSLNSLSDMKCPPFDTCEVWIKF